jgi:hypothetical protein
MRIWAMGLASRPAAADLEVVVAVVGDAAAGAAEREGGADDRGQAHGFERVHAEVEPRADVELAGGLLRRGDDGGLRVLEPDALHRLAEELAVLGHLDRGALGADHLDTVLREDAHFFQRERGVETRLAAHRGEKRVRALLLDDLGDDFGRDGFDVGGVRHPRVRHDRGGVRVDEDDAVAFLAQRLAGLGAGVVELAGLADDDGTRSDDHDRLDVGSLRHRGPPADGQIGCVIGIGGPGARGGGGGRMRLRRIRMDAPCGATGWWPTPAGSAVPPAGIFPQG